MKKVKNLEKIGGINYFISEDVQTNSSSLSLSDSIVEIDTAASRNGRLQIESKLLKGQNSQNQSSSSMILFSSTLNCAKSILTNKTTAALKPTTLTIYLLSTLFLLQLVLTTLGFYLQFAYLKSQNEMFEIKINSFFNKIIDDLNSDFDELLRRASRKDVSDADEDFMILNLTHAIGLDDLNADELNRTILAYRENLFDAVLKENLNSRTKRNAKKPASSFHKKVNSNQSSAKSNSNQDDHFYLSSKHPKNLSGDHFLIQAYSRISVC